MAIRRLFEKVQMRQELVTKSDFPKFHLSVIMFYIRRFAAQCLKGLRSEQRQKVNNTIFQKTLHVKIFISINGQY